MQKSLFLRKFPVDRIGSARVIYLLINKSGQMFYFKFAKIVKMKFFLRIWPYFLSALVRRVGEGYEDSQEDRKYMNDG